MHIIWRFLYSLQLKRIWRYKDSSLARIQIHAYINGKWKAAHSGTVRQRQMHDFDKHDKMIMFKHSRYCLSINEIAVEKYCMKHVWIILYDVNVIPYETKQNNWFPKKKTIEGMYKRIYRKDEIEYQMSVLSSCLDIPS